MIHLNKIKIGSIIEANIDSWSSISIDEDPFIRNRKQFFKYDRFVYLGYKEKEQIIKSPLANRMGFPDEHLAFILKINVLYNTQRFWILIRESRLNINELPNDLKNGFRYCSWLNLYL